MGYRPIPTSPISDASGPGDRVRWDKQDGYGLNAEAFIKKYLAERGNDRRKGCSQPFAEWFRNREQEREEARKLYG